MRNLSILLGLSAVVACAPEEQDPLTAAVPEGYVVSGTVPDDVDLEAVVNDIPEGGFAVIGAPGTEETAIVMAEGNPLSRVASNEFSLVSAVCTDCVDPTCASSMVRTIQFGLQHNTGSSAESFSLQQVSARNFSNANPNPSSWTAPVVSTRNISVSGTLATCSSFNYTFDVMGAQRVFVTSTTSNGNLGGLAGADATCQARANAASLGGTWKAWLSDGTTSAASRLAQSSGPYQRLDGVVVGNSFNDLVDGAIGGPINVDEFGTSVAASNVWTGTNSNGSSNALNCNNWTSASAGVSGVAGRAAAGIVNSRWTNYTTQGCNSARRLYCLEQ